MIKRVSIIFFLVIVLIQCDSKKSKSISINQSETPFSDLYELALEKGDTIAYHHLSMGYMDSPNDWFLSTALKMANRYDNKDAYMDVFYCLTNYYHKKEEELLVDLDSRTRNMALEYLKLASDKGEINAKKLLGEYYLEGKYLKKK